MLSITEIWSKSRIQTGEIKQKSIITKLINSIESCESSNDYESFYSDLKTILQIDQIAEPVKEYIKASSNIDEISGITGFKSCKNYFNFIEFSELFPDSYNRLFPAFRINIDLWIVIPTGKLLFLNHDATFYEIGGEILDRVKDFNQFIKEFSMHGSKMDLKTRLNFELILVERKLNDFWEINEKQQKEILDIYLKMINVKWDEISNIRDFVDEDITIACEEYLLETKIY